MDAVINLFYTAEQYELESSNVGIAAYLSPDSFNALIHGESTSTCSLLVVVPEE
jgi:hypothetical protein